MKLLYIDCGITAEPSEKWPWLPPEIDVFLTAETVSDAREIILRELPDLIVSEVELPDGSGIGLLEWIRTEIGEGPAVILYTRSRNFEDARAAVSLKAFDYILLSATRRLNHLVDCTVTVFWKKPTAEYNRHLVQYETFAVIVEIFPFSLGFQYPHYLFSFASRFLDFWISGLAPQPERQSHDSA